LYDWSKQMLLGQGSPLHSWFEKQKLAKILEEHKSARTDHGKRLYALSMLAVWASKL
jgi:hypothetical protein